jgi:hypothetical protein
VNGVVVEVEMEEEQWARNGRRTKSTLHSAKDGPRWNETGSRMMLPAH